MPTKSVLSDRHAHNQVGMPSNGTATTSETISIQEKLLTEMSEVIAQLGSSLETILMPANAEATLGSELKVTESIITGQLRMNNLTLESMISRLRGLVNRVGL